MTIEEVVRQVLREEHGDVIRESVRAVARELMEAEVSELIGAAHGERTDCRCRPSTTTSRSRRRTSSVSGRGALLTLLAYGALRVGEALALRWRDVRLHAAPRRLDVLDAKTPTGVREVHLSPELAAVLIGYRDARPPRSRRPRGEDPLWPSHCARARSRAWALAKVHRAADVASAARIRRDLPPFPT